MNTETILLNLLYEQWIKTHIVDDNFTNYIYNETKRSVVQIADFEWIFIA